MVGAHPCGHPEQAQGHAPTRVRYGRRRRHSPYQKKVAPAIWMLWQQTGRIASVVNRWSKLFTQTLVSTVYIAYRRIICTVSVNVGMPGLSLTASASPIWKNRCQASLWVAPAASVIGWRVATARTIRGVKYSGSRTCSSGVNWSIRRCTVSSVASVMITSAVRDSTIIQRRFNAQWLMNHSHCSGIL